MTMSSKELGRVYKMNRGVRHMWHAFAALTIVMCFVTTPFHLAGAMEHSIPPETLAWVDLLMIGFVALMSWGIERRVILYDDAIVVDGWYSTTKLQKSEIRGRRMGRSGKPGGFWYILIPADRSKRELDLPPSIQVDKYFFAWMKPIPLVKEPEPTLPF